MKLYYSRGACSLGVRITLLEMGVNCEFESVNIQTKKTESGKDFNTINPKGAVPVLQLDDGQILTENIAIQQYITDKHKAYQLFPAVSDFKHFRVLEWLSYVSSDLHKSIGILFNPLVTKGARDEFIVPTINRKLDFLNDHLAKSELLIGNQFTVADSYLFVVLSWLPMIKISLTAYPHIMRYIEILKKRPSIIKACAEEGID